MFEKIREQDHLSCLKELIDRVKRHPEDRRAWKEIGQLCWDLGDMETAQRLFALYGDDARHRVGIDLIPYERGDEVLMDFGINTNPGSQVEVSALDLAGWVLGRRSPALRVEVVHEGRVILRSPVCAPTPDLADRYPDLPGAGNCGFRVMVGLLGMPLEFELSLFALFKDGHRLPLARLGVQRKPLSSGFRPVLQPLMVTSLGRMGTTRLMQLLREHPSIVVHSRYPYEARVLSYCTFMFKTHSEMMNLIQQVDPFGYLSGFFGHLHPGYIRPIGYGAIDYQFRHRFELIYTEQALASLQRSVDEFYLRLAAEQGKRGALFLAEKMYPGDIPPQVWELYPGAREIILVRDLRDMICSVLAFNRKRGFVDFGRQCVSTDEEYIETRVRAGAMRLLNSWKQRAGKAYLLRYEDLILNPEEALSGILRYLGLDDPPSVVEGVLKRASGDAPELRIHRTTPDPAASIGRWKREMSPEMQALCNDLLGEILREFGYTTGSDDLQGLQLERGRS